MLGEYAVLNGGPCLIVTTEPSFTMTVDDNKPASLTHIHKDSPAGKLYYQHHALLKNLNIHFENPYMSLGGLGASSAEFLCMYQLISALQDQPIKMDELLQTYWQVAFNGEGAKPSGADVIAQFHQGLCFYYPKEAYCESYTWPFNDLSFILVHSGHKLKTHNYLRSQARIPYLPALSTSVLQAHEALLKQQPTQFIDAFIQFGNALKDLHLVTNETLQLLETLSKDKNILAAKGAGAMGADVIVLLSEKQHKTSLINKLTQMGLATLATEDHLCCKRERINVEQTTA